MRLSDGMKPSRVSQPGLAIRGSLNMHVSIIAKKQLRDHTLPGHIERESSDPGVIRAAGPGTSDNRGYV